jgi:hypothetical protein
MASFYDTGGGGGTFVGGRRIRTNAGYSGYGGYGDTAVPRETRPNGDAPTMGGNADPFGGGTTPPSTPPPLGATTNPSGSVNASDVDYGQPNLGWLMGYDYGKLNDPTHMSAKYQIGRTLARFDPTKGLTPDALLALNALGLGTFSGAGDRLSLTGVTDAGRSAGLDPRDFTGDFIQNWTGANPNDHSGARWTYDAYADPETTAATDPFAAAAAMLGNGLSASASSPPDMSWITELIRNLTPAQQTPAATIPAAAPAATVPVVAPQPSASQPTPTFGGGYVTPGYGAMGNATQSMALQLSAMLRDPQYANDPMVRRLLATIGGA